MPDDFTTYAQARWPALVAFLVDEGAERQEAEERATAGLARVRPRWREVRDVHDLDQRVLAVVTGRTDPAQSERFLTSLAAERAPESLPTREPPVADIVDRARAARRRTTRRWAAGLLAVVVVAGGGWLVARQATRPPGVHEATNPLPIPWYFDGKLHLRDVVVDRPQVIRLVSVQGGVVAADRHGRVTLVADDGRVHDLGRTSPGGVLVVDSGRNLVAWAGSASAGSSAAHPAMVVYDVSGARVVATVALPNHTSDPLAIDQGRVDLTDGEGQAYSWAFETGSASLLPVVRTLLDAAGGVTVNQSGEAELQVLHGPADVLSLHGRWADLSPDGRRLLTCRSSAPCHPLVYDAADGHVLDLGFPDSQYVLAEAFDDDGGVLLAARHRADRHLGDRRRGDDSRRLSASGPILLVECRPDTHVPCETLAQLANDSAYPPVLAQ